MPNRVEHAGLVPAAAVALALLGGAVPVGAQPNADRSLSVGAGIGFASPFHADFDFTPFAWDVAVRAGTGRARFEVAFAEWRHARTTEVPGAVIPGGSGPGLGPLVRQESTRTSRVGQINLLAHARFGGIELSGGGGVGVLVLGRSFRQTIAPCSDVTSPSCASFESSDESIGLTMQGVFGVDVYVARAVSVFAQARLVVLTRDVAGTDLRYTGGLRVLF